MRAWAGLHNISGYKAKISSTCQIIVLPSLGYPERRYNRSICMGVPMEPGETSSGGSKTSIIIAISNRVLVMIVSSKDWEYHSLNTWYQSSCQDSMHLFEKLKPTGLSLPSSKTVTSSSGMHSFHRFRSWLIVMWDQMDVSNLQLDERRESSVLLNWEGSSIRYSGTWRDGYLFIF